MRLEYCPCSYLLLFLSLCQLFVVFQLSPSLIAKEQKNDSGTSRAKNGKSVFLKKFRASFPPLRRDGGVGTIVRLPPRTICWHPPQGAEGQPRERCKKAQNFFSRCQTGSNFPRLFQVGFQAQEKWCLLFRAEEGKLHGDFYYTLRVVNLTFKLLDMDWSLGIAA